MNQETLINVPYEELNPSQLRYYGVLTKDGRVLLDTERFRQFIPLPDEKIGQQGEKYYTPSKVHMEDYFCNCLGRGIAYTRDLWDGECSSAIKALETTGKAEAKARFDALCRCKDFDDSMKKEQEALIESMTGAEEYRFVIRSICISFFERMMSKLEDYCFDALSTRGYSDPRFTRKAFERFVEEKQSLPLQQFDTFPVYDEAYCVWNFLKRPSVMTYNALKRKYPNRVIDLKGHRIKGSPDLYFLKIDKKYITYFLDHIGAFYDEVSTRVFGENLSDAKWDYDTYFVVQGIQAIRINENSSDLSPHH